MKLDDGILAQRYSQPYPSRLELQGLPRYPTEFRISAAVVVPTGDKKELFTSVPYRLIVREPLIKAFIHGLTEPGVLSGSELDTVGVTCIARGNKMHEVSCAIDFKPLSLLKFIVCSLGIVFLKSSSAYQIYFLACRHLA